VRLSKANRVAVIPHKDKVVWLIKAGVALLLSLIFWELILSQLILQKPTSQSHPVLGRIYGQGLYVQGKEGYGRTVLNELGLRSPPLGALPADAFRVLVLGDSYTQAMQVSDEVAFPEHLSELLGTSSSVINSGREGGSPADYIALETFNKTTFQPDSVVVQLNEADFTRDLLSKNQTFYYEPTAQGYTLRENKALVSSNALASRFVGLQSILNFSVMRLALERIEGLRAGKTDIAAPEANQPPQSDGSLERFVVQELKKAYSTPILLYIPEINYFANDYAEPHLTEQYLAEAARDADVTFISLLPDFAELYKTEHKTAHGFANTQPGMGHINALGHQIVAERLVQALSPMLDIENAGGGQ
jgi:lysophospholipase L1-like esterase